MTITKTRIGVAIGAAILVIAAFAADAAGGGAAAQAAGTPDPRILVIDRGAILRQSASGRDMIEQVEALSKKVEEDLKGDDEKLRADIKSFQQQAAILAADVRDQRQRNLQSRQETLQKKIQTRQNEIQAGVAKARMVVEAALGPILEGIMLERGANLLFDRNAVVLGTVDVDVTAVAIQRLDQKLPKVKVEPVDPATLQQQQ